jgi:hypothetical protein
MYCAAVRVLDIKNDLPLAFHIDGFPHLLEIFPSIHRIKRPLLWGGRDKNDKIERYYIVESFTTPDMLKTKQYTIDSDLSPTTWAQ